MKILLVLSLFFLSSLSQAKVWEAAKTWDSTSEAAWQTWIKSTSVQKDFFIKEGPWKGLKLDCADTVYALRIIFAYENKLPFKIASGISNQSTIVDKKPVGLARVRAFIEYVSDNNGALDLATGDSYPVAINDIKSGDIFVTEWRLNNQSIRHTHVIKDVSPFGYFHLIYGTTPAQSRVMSEIFGMPLSSIEGSPWGFKRFRQPQDYGKTPKAQSLEQYEILKQIGPELFFDEIQKHLAQIPEGIGDRIDRQMKNLCGLLNNRAVIVQESLDFVRSINNRCVNDKEFDLYSTSTRDSRMANGIKMLIHDWQRLSTEGGFHEASLTHQMAMDYLSGNDRSEYARTQLLGLCSIRFGETVDIDLKTFFDDYQNGRISSHPNDSIEARWGLSEQRTQCKSLY